MSIFRSLLRTRYLKQKIVICIFVAIVIIALQKQAVYYEASLKDALHYDDVFNFNGDINSESEVIPEEECVIPKLNVIDPAVMKFYKKYDSLNCFQGEEWVSLRNGKFFISPKAEELVGTIKCDAAPIERDGDYKNRKLAKLKHVFNGTKLIHDFYFVDCTSSNNKNYRTIHAGIRHDEEIAKRPKKISGLGLDILMFGQDSLSRMAMLRHQPKTRKYLVEELGAIELQGHTILGDGTTAQLMPMLIGKREEELPEARRGFQGAKPVDHIFPFIWNDFREKGYATMWSEPSPDIGTFTYRMVGFHKQPVDHYYRPFSFEEDKHARVTTDKLCVGSRSTYSLVLDYALEMWKTYPKDRRKFAFGFISEPSHAENSKISMLDDEVKDYLQKFHDGGHLNNTLLIVMSDHGNRASDVRLTDQGKLEERLPYFSLRFPPWFHQKYPEIISNMKHNAKKLTTPFDIYETFKEVMDFTGAGEADISKRGVSLFKKIPPGRTCKSADIDDHWCTCLDWRAAKNDSKEVKMAAEYAVGFINILTAKYRDKCANLELTQIMSASKLITKEAVLKFKDTNDGGRGRFGKMTDTTKRSLMTFQLNLVTSPNNGKYEITVTYNTKTKTHLLDRSRISRVNKYGDQPKCVASFATHLREFCYCLQ